MQSISYHVTYMQHICNLYAVYFISCDLYATYVQFICNLFHIMWPICNIYAIYMQSISYHVTYMQHICNLYAIYFISCDLYATYMQFICNLFHIMWPFIFVTLETELTGCSFLRNWNLKKQTLANILALDVRCCNSLTVFVRMA